MVEAPRRVPKIVAEAQRFGWFQWHRLDWIEEMLNVYGFINREHICRKFDLSVPAASNDLRIFQQINPGRMVYDKSAKHYRPSPEAKP